MPPLAHRVIPRQRFGATRTSSRIYEYTAALNSLMARALLLSPSSVGLGVLWRVAVHGLQLAVGEGESRRHIHLA
ncbi:MAG TPA: hypothetical protein VK337_16570, partial [Xanthobacteraceae bacterium]|nr:hypothetical protein [Xanthobacteraceae bacterium]